MIEMAFFGQAFADAEAKESRSGGRYARLLALTSNADDGDAVNSSSLMVKLIVPAEHIDEALAIKRGDRLYVEGAASIGVWNTERGAKPSVTVKVHFIRKARIGLLKEAPKPPPAEYVAAALNRPTIAEFPAFMLRKIDVADEENGACQ